MIAFAPCKINIGLKILNKRKDDYHNIDSYFYAVPLYDILEIQESEQDKLTQTGIISTAKTEDNLVYHALQLLRHDFYIPPVHIHLHKQIPKQAGLGGGSSDATAVLKLLQNYFKLNISHEKLFDLALNLGSDCPFFIKHQASRVQGRGEIVLPWNFSLKSKYIVIVKPFFSISTKNAFSSQRKKATDTLPNISEIPFDQWLHYFTNDFESILTNKQFSLLEIKKTFLQSSAFYVSLSGSGSAVFGLFHSMPNMLFPSSYFVWKSQLH